MARRRTSKVLRRAASHAWALLLGAVAIVVVGVGLFGPSPIGIRHRASPPLTMARARASNAAVPIEPRRRGRAAPFRFHGGPAALAQATDCLATAALYEAGDDARGQQAIIQVVLNRVRARGFPATVCGVVYQGHDRATGCQFSFTCDGSLVRRPVHLGWASARRAARRALAGYVVDDVGQAIQYHADWTVPYWRDSMTKVARVGSHLFYVRTRSSWGERAAPR